MTEKIQIHGSRLMLRPLEPGEIDAEWQAMANADSITIATLPDEQSFRARLERSGQLIDGWLDLAIDLRGEMLGRIQTFVPSDRLPGPGVYNIGIGVREEARGKGYGREAVALLTDWLFGHADAIRVEAGTDPANAAMQAVLEHLGWTLTGQVREHGRDWLLYAITRQDWEDRRGR